MSWRFLTATLLAACLPATAAEAGPSRDPIDALLITGGCCHDYATQKKILTEGISKRASVKWTVVHQGGNATDAKIPYYKDPTWAGGFDVVVHNECFAKTKDPEWVDRILKPHREGTPAVLIHCAMHCYRVDSDAWFRFCGVTSHGHGDKYPIDVANQAPDHPIMKGFGERWETPAGELYLVDKVGPNATPLADAPSRDSGEREVCVWTNKYHGTRVFGTTLGHHNKTMASETYLDMVTRGLLWATESLDSGTPLRTSVNERKLARDLALGRPVQAANHQDGHPPEHAVDGDPSTRWCAQDSDSGYWWQVDLGKARDLDKARIRWEFDGRRYTYRIEGSADGEAWSTLADRTNNPSRKQVQTVDLAGDGVRYVRITVTGQSDGAWASFYELSLYGDAKVARSEAKGWRPSSTDPRREKVETPEGFQASVFAAPPHVNYPTCVTTAPDGTVFVGVDKEGSLGTKGGRGKVVRCVDDDGDGVADRFNVFANVDHPRGLIYQDGTLWVLHPPHLTAFHDEDRDGVADRSERLVTDISTDQVRKRGADHTTNGIDMGVDGWIYIAMGDFGCVGAKGTDGSTLTVKGGGIVRVRPDGSDLELFAHGLRNVYDVAVGPRLNVFTRDNTNDGGGWFVRLSHIMQTAEYGYPTLFKNFPGDIMPPLADYGGGSGTGVAIVDEPGLGEPYGDALYTCDWGTNEIYRHPLEKKGATFKAEQKTFVSIPRPTDIEADARGRLYLASWDKGRFKYKGPDVGFLVQLRRKGSEAPSVPDLDDADPKALVDHLAAESERVRLAAQRRLLRLGAEEAPVERIETLIRSGKALEGRIAALFTLKQLLGADAHDTLLSMAGRPDHPLRRFALRALADRKEALDGVPVDPFVDALDASDPRVVRQAVIGLGRLGKTDAADALVPLTASDDRAIAHLAVRALIELEAVQACLDAVHASSPAVAKGALRAVKQVHKPAAVDGLIQRLKSTDDRSLRRRILVALMRLHYKEAPYKGGWWTTRPDTHGPYYDPVAWSETDRIASLLKKRLLAADAETTRFLVDELERHQIRPDLTAAQLLRVARRVDSVSSPAVAWLAEEEKPPADAVSLLRKAAVRESVSTDVRAAAMRALGRVQSANGLDALLEVVPRLGRLDKMDGRLRGAWKKLRKDGRFADRIEALAKMTDSDGEAERQAAYSILLHLASKNGDEDAVQRAKRLVAEGWNRSRTAADLLRVVGALKLKRAAEQVRLHAGSEDKRVRQAVTYAAEQLGVELAKADDSDDGRTVGALAFEKLLASTRAAEGDPAVGKKLFRRQGCVACHTTSKKQEAKGPDLSDIATRYDEKQLIESIVRPSAKIAQGFATRWFKLDDGTVHEGFVTRESGDAVAVRNVAGVVTRIPKKRVAEQGTREGSMMPKGIVNNLTPEQLASLVAYLQSLPK